MSVRRIDQVQPSADSDRTGQFTQLRYRHQVIRGDADQVGAATDRRRVHAVEIQRGRQGKIMLRIEPLGERSSVVLEVLLDAGKRLSRIGIVETLVEKPV